MNQSRVIGLVGLLVLATAAHTLAGATDNELQFNGNKPAATDGNEPSLPSNNGVNPFDSNNNFNNDKLNGENGFDFGQQQQQQQQQPFGQWTPSRPVPGQRRRPSPLGLPPFPSLFGDSDPFGSSNGFGFGFGNGLSSPLMPSEWSSPSTSPLGRLFAPIDKMFDGMHRRMNSVFDEMRSKAGNGEEVTFFQKDNVAYKKTCKIERVDPQEMLQQQSVPDEQKQQFVPDNRQIDQQVKPQQLLPQLDQPQQEQQQQQEKKQDEQSSTPKTI